MQSNPVNPIQPSQPIQSNPIQSNPSVNQSINPRSPIRPINPIQSIRSKPIQSHQILSNQSINQSIPSIHTIQPNPIDPFSAFNHPNQSHPVYQSNQSNPTNQSSPIQSTESHSPKCNPPTPLQQSLPMPPSIPMGGRVIIIIRLMAGYALGFPFICCVAHIGEGWPDSMSDASTSYASATTTPRHRG